MSAPLHPPRETLEVRKAASTTSLNNLIAYPCVPFGAGLKGAFNTLALILSVGSLTGCDLNKSIRSGVEYVASKIEARGTTEVADGRAKKGSTDKAEVKISRQKDRPLSALDESHQSINLSTAKEWRVNESGAWWGKWTKGNEEGLYYIENRNSDNGVIERRTAVVRFIGDEVAAERNDGIHYKGILSEDGMRISGIVWNDGGGKGNWDVEVSPELQSLAAKPRAPRLAPEGIVFLLKSVHIESEGVLVGVHPGTVLTILKDEGDSYRVTNDENEFKVRKHFVTNSFDVAERALTKDKRAQSALARWGNEQKLVSDEAEAQKRERFEAERKKREAAEMALLEKQLEPPNNRYRKENDRPVGNPLNGGAYDRSSIWRYRY